MADAAVIAMRDLRHTRQLHRLGSLDWFEVAYRVYLFGIFGGGAILWLSASVKDDAVSESTIADAAQYGPTLMGLVAALAILAGLRGGAQGGPLALEGPDVAHLLLAPIDRRTVLARPAFQRLRSAVFAGAGIAAVAGQLAGRRLPGSPAAWFFAGLLFGTTVAMMWTGGALVAHVLAVRSSVVVRGAVTAAGVALVTWQAVALATGTTGPVDGVGDLAFWGWEVHPIDLIGTVIGAAAVVAGFVTLRRVSLDALARRSSLVAQLRFAVTMQDLRTVILLRRQLNQERFRRHPWRRLRPSRARDGLTKRVVRRGWQGLGRFPLTRLARMAAVAAGFGLLMAWTVRGTTPALFAAALAAFVLGLEAMEPLSQEVDQADRSDSLPIPRGDLMFRHLVAPAIALVPFALIAAASAVAVLGVDAAASAAILAVPLTLGGACGAVVSIVRDAPDPVGLNNQETFMTPEMAGFTTTIRLVWPLVVSFAGCAAVLLPREAWKLGESPEAAAARGAVGAALFVALVAYWVKVRDPLHRRIREFFDEGRRQTATSRSGSRSS